MNLSTVYSLEDHITILINTTILGIMTFQMTATNYIIIGFTKNFIL